MGWGGGVGGENSNLKTLFYMDCSLGSIKEREREGRKRELGGGGWGGGGGRACKAKDWI